jgi:hypothetical protein
MAYSNRPIRRSALIGPWGVGAIVPFPSDESLMIAGLDMWRYNDPQSFLIKDERLIKRLGVKELRWPPDFREYSADPENCNLKIPAVRFPTWHYCPFCGTMRKTTYYEPQPVCDCFQWPRGRKCNPRSRYKRKLIPERFLVVCPNGHIDDFPVAEWLHSDSVHNYNPNDCIIRRSTGGTSAALTGVFYECTCGAKKSLAGVTRPGALNKIGYRCKGSKPWLGIDSDEDNNPCGRDDVKVLLRGATNVWFADTRSSIHIPTDDSASNRRIIGILNEFFDVLRTHRRNGEWNRQFINVLAEKYKVDKDTLYNAFVKRNDSIDELLEVADEMSEEEYRLEEYKVLIRNSGSDAQDFHSINYPITAYDPIIRKYFKSISLVPKLRETRAFVGFSRLEPSNATISERKKMIRIGGEDWLPAIEVCGEGIFFEFNSDLLSHWAQKEIVSNRIKKLNNTYHNVKFGSKANGELRPEFVLIHTFVNDKIELTVFGQ